MFNIKNFSTVFMEATIVGLVLVVFVEGVTMAFKQMKIAEMNYAKYLILFLAGALFHLVFEYTGINKWYVENYLRVLR